MERPTPLISFHPSILIMSNSVPALSGIQLTPEIQTLFEQILNQKLQDYNRPPGTFGINAGVNILIDSLHRNRK